jgi:uncharacterized membrane protein (DUF373 family)
MNYMETFHKAVITALTALMGFVVILATLELIYLIAMDILSPPLMLLEIDELLDIFGYFLLILIGVELLETLRIYLKEHALNVQVVLLVAMIAIARKGHHPRFRQNRGINPDRHRIHNPLSGRWIPFGQEKSR